MSLIVCYIILIFEVFTGFWCLYRSFKYICNQNQKTKNKMELNEKKPNILIVIPCLREQDIIIQTLNYFLELTNDLDNVKLLVVTTQKEEFEKENNLHLKDQFIKDVKSHHNSMIANPNVASGCKEQLKDVLDVYNVLEKNYNQVLSKTKYA